MPSITLYDMEASPPCRVARLTAKHLGLDLNLIPIALTKGEHKTEAFLRMNPQHTIPTMKDGDFILWESRAIQAYFANAYGKDDSLYPSDPKTRAKVNRLLFFDSSVLYYRFALYLFPVMFGKDAFDPAKKEKLDEAIGFLNTFLADDHAFAATDNITLADQALSVSMTTIVACEFCDLKKYPNIEKWLQRCQKEMIGYHEINEGPSAAFGAYMKANTSK